jgi:hypothetical protein
MPEISLPSDQRAQGIPGARCTRGLVCKTAQKNAHEHTGSAEAIRHSLRNGFNGLYVLPGDRAFLSPSPRRVALRELDASVGASGPHDFAVRIQSALVSCAACVHRIPPRICDDHDTPLGGVRRRRFRFDLGARSTTKTATHGTTGKITTQDVTKPITSIKCNDGYRGVYHRARIRATRWLNSSCALLNIIRRAGRREPAARSHRECAKRQ